MKTSWSPLHTNQSVLHVCGLICLALAPPFEVVWRLSYLSWWLVAEIRRRNTLTTRNLEQTERMRVYVPALPGAQVVNVWNLQGKCSLVRFVCRRHVRILRTWARMSGFGTNAAQPMWTVWPKDKSTQPLGMAKTTLNLHLNKLSFQSHAERLKSRWAKFQKVTVQFPVDWKGSVSNLKLWTWTTSLKI